MLKYTTAFRTTFDEPQAFLSALNFTHKFLWVERRTHKDNQDHWYVVFGYWSGTNGAYGEPEKRQITDRQNIRRIDTLVRDYEVNKTALKVKEIKRQEIAKNYYEEALF